MGPRGPMSLQTGIGHRSIRTTVRYTRVSNKLIASTKSPVDVLGTPAQKKIG
jgi:integrase/recombinase XerD